MSKLTMCQAFNGARTDINDIDLGATTPSQIISAAIENGILQRVTGEEFKVVGKNNQPVMEDLPLSELGFEDGDTLTVISKPTGAAR